MKFFVDTADVAEIKDLAATGVLDGVTTNPSLIAKSGRKFLDVIAEICAVVRRIAPNVAIKLPLTWDGLKACKALSSEGVACNVTLCFSANQALLAAKAGAAYISPFIGRLDDIGEDGMQLIRDIRRIYDNYGSLKTEILSASIRSSEHVKQAALAGSDVATVPPGVLRELVKHPLTDKGLDAFNADWAKTGQSIL